MTDEWRTDFSFEDDGFAYATVTHDGETKKHNLGPGGEAVVAAMAWVEYNDVREAITDQVFRDVANFFEYDRERLDLAQEIRTAADELFGKEEYIPIRE